MLCTSGRRVPPPGQPWGALFRETHVKSLVLSGGTCGLETYPYLLRLRDAVLVVA